MAKLTPHLVSASKVCVGYICPITEKTTLAPADSIDVSDSSYHESSHSHYPAECTCEVDCPKCGKRHTVYIYS